MKRFRLSIILSFFFAFALFGFTDQRYPVDNTENSKIINEIMPDENLQYQTLENLGLATTNPTTVITKELLENYDNSTFLIECSDFEHAVYDLKGLEYLPDDVKIEYRSDYYWGGTHKYNFLPVVSNPVFLNISDWSNSGDYSDLLPLIESGKTVNLDVSSAISTADGGEPIIPSEPFYVEDMKSFSIPISHLLNFGSEQVLNSFIWYGSENYSIEVEGYLMNYEVNYDSVGKNFDFKLSDEIPEDEYNSFITEYMFEKTANSFDYSTSYLSLTAETEYLPNSEETGVVTFPDIRIAEKKGMVTVQYKDTENNIIADDISFEGKVGDLFDIESSTYLIDIDGYELAEEMLPQEMSGAITEEEQVFSIYYKKNEVVHPTEPTKPNKPAEPVIPTNPKISEVVNTGDNSNVLLWGGLMTLSITCGLILIVKKKGIN
ncbi:MULTISPECIES: MucBP domain-containing protein [unclassified Breznakia]|uniref:MucBP domain-containing protein n=1 Tax=unclassified Breznakia TaxID=2623764 RepID=UPI002473632F|nr:MULTISPECIES: MucBP domain-containing protein [unclassified Breznakia]MDH6367034.1 LPXTG-motif cell wall-anchored protein [Breznakia sp. PH1-1]MDH6404194.1 LPXTG-motif cell wall-anchored protein [Breznakia sp. PF1-11]MDH6411921.1 LPXTG-motif cell wall-anchored protein [Breznakia sp. PFB1-11]MDH6414182.1 LPXTG-motif cell wall-anchored protein [Breznakia sp. PFB1-14]MDH6415995.1 LPXTG-motif cell wall-anchored protein [Breznakia sp. PFB1-4]